MDWKQRFERIDLRISGWMEKYGRLLLRFSLAAIFIWFAAEKR